MKNCNQIGVYLPISEVFPEIQNDFATFQYLLSCLSRTDTLFWCARLNLIISTTENIKAQQFALQKFFTSEEIAAINDYARSHGGAENIRVFFRGQLLELFRWATLFCVDHPEDGNTFEKPQVRRKFAQVALIASDIWANRTFKGKFSLDDGIEIGRKRALGPTMMSIEATTSMPELTQSLGRGWTLFSDYFPKFYPSFKDDFFYITGISVEQYFVSFAMMATNFMNPRMNAGIFDINKIREHSLNGDVFFRYFELESRDADDLKQVLWNNCGSSIKMYEDAPDDYYRSLREKPILRTNDGRGVIFDPVFYSQQASVGPLFHIRRSPNCRGQDAFNAFGQAFEKYTLDILTRMFASRGNLINRLVKNVKALDSQGNSIEADAILNDVSEIVLFEIKSGFIADNVIVHNDYEVLLHTIREKYSINRSSKGGRKLKGVGQLARIATSLAKGKLSVDGIDFRGVQLIFPVMVVHDKFLTSPVYGNFFASEFAAHLQPDSTLPNGMFVKEDKRIAPVIILSVDDLENLETSIEHFGFRNLLKDYSSACPDRLMSLNNYIAYSERYRKDMLHNRALASKGLEILTKCREDVFGKKFRE